MLRTFVCPACQKEISVSSKMAGATGTCSCGQSFRIPAPTKSSNTRASQAATIAPASSPDPTAAVHSLGAPDSVGEGYLSVICSCGKALLAPVTAIGKGAKCSCGQTTQILPPNESAQASFPGAQTAGRAPAIATSPNTPVIPAEPLTPSAKVLHPADNAAAAMARVVVDRSRPVGASSTGMSPPNESPAIAADSPTGQPMDPSRPDSPFHYLTQNELSDAASLSKEQLEAEERRRTTKNMMQRAQAELGEGLERDRQGAADHLKNTRDILLGVGVIRVSLALFSLWVAPSWALAISQTTQGDASQILLSLRVVAGLEILVAILFLVCAALVFAMPVTITVSVTGVYIFMEVIGLILAPFSFFNIRAWVFRVLILAGLFQAINNASYYRYIR